MEDSQQAGRKPAGFQFDQLSFRQVIGALSAGNSGSLCRRLADDLRQELHLTSPPFNPLEVAQRLGLEVTYESIPARAQFREETGRAWIVVGSSASALSPTARARRAFAIAHEIGHFVLRREIRAVVPSYTFEPDDPVEERCADQFAAELLMPARVIAADIRACHAAIDGLLNLVELYEVSLEAMLLRATELYDGAVLGTIWNFQGSRCGLHWSAAKRLDGTILCDTGNTPIELAYESKTSIPCFGSLDLLQDGQRERWKATSLRLTGSTKVVSILSKNRDLIHRWHVRSRNATIPPVLDEAIQERLPFLRSQRPSPAKKGVPEKTDHLSREEPFVRLVKNRRADEETGLPKLELVV